MPTFAKGQKQMCHLSFIFLSHLKNAKKELVFTGWSIKTKTNLRIIYNHVLAF